MNDIAPVRRVLSFAKPGEVVPIRKETGGVGPMMVFGACDQRHTYFCVDHELPLYNWHQLEVHVAGGGTHHFVRWCKVHGRPESGDASDRERLIRHEQLESGL